MNVSIVPRNLVAATGIPVRPIAARRRPTMGRKLPSLLRNGPAVVALAVLVVIVGAAIFAEWIAPHDPNRGDFARRVLPPFWLDQGTLDYPLGTDKLGRDLLSRIIYGARVSLILGSVASLGSAILGVVLGLIAGYVGGRPGDFVMRVAEAQLAFPFLVAAVAIIAIVGPSFQNLVGLLAVWGWATFAKVVRAEVLSVKEKEYVEAARVIGADAPRILRLHVLPNVISPVIVLWTFWVASVIVAESGLSFIGLGVQPPTPAWGSMLADGRQTIDSAWWLATFPGLAIMLLVLAVNVLGDAFREILDPNLG